MRTREQGLHPPVSGAMMYGHSKVRPTLACGLLKRGSLAQVRARPGGAPWACSSPKGAETTTSAAGAAFLPSDLARLRLPLSLFKINYLIVGVIPYPHFSTAHSFLGDSDTNVLASFPMPLHLMSTQKKKKILKRWLAVMSTCSHRGSSSIPSPYTVVHSRHYLQLLSSDLCSTTHARGILMCMQTHVCTHAKKQNQN